MKYISESQIDIFKETSKMVTGSDRRKFQANITKEYLDGNARKAENVFGWGRETVKLGMKEIESGFICLIDVHKRGNTRTEEKSPQIEEEIRRIVEPSIHTDPKFQSSFKYTRITSKKVLQALIDTNNFTEEQLPTERTMNNILNRMGYTLKRIAKIKPLKKIKETDAIFDNVQKANEEANNDSTILRISMDTKAKVNIGDFSRGGKARAKEAVRAGDHDMNPSEKLVPFGIVEVASGQITTVVGNSAETSDFIVDSLQIWWDDQKRNYPDVKTVEINSDNGPSVSSYRTQFIKRMVEFAEKNGINVHLVYYPPYHSKYNPIERCWGVLERHWNGAILDSVDTALEWIKTMKWKGINPIVHFLNSTYEKGIKLTKKEMKRYDDKVKRSEQLPRWDVFIEGAF